MILWPKIPRKRKTITVSLFEVSLTVEELRGEVELQRLADSIIRRGRRPTRSLVGKGWVRYKVAVVTVRTRGQPPRP